MKQADRSLSFAMTTLGCPKNLADSEYVASLLISNGMLMTATGAPADVLIVNTCAFIDEARMESEGEILEACRLKKAGRYRRIVVAGCLPQRYGRKLAAELPEVDAFVGVDALDAAPAVVRRIAAGSAPASAAFAVPRPAVKLFEPRRQRVIFSGGAHAYVKIAEGCNNRCGFCVIPSIRGRYRSRRIPDIVRQAEWLLARGIRELVLVSQDSTAYGTDLGGGANLPALLRALGALGGEFRIRVMYCNPNRLTDEFLDCFNSIPSLCRYLDVPIQHSHPDMLRAMLRAGRRAPDVRSLPGRIRRAAPGIALRTSFLVGYPGERERHFTDLLGFVGDAEFDHVGVFVFSPQEGTRAFTAPNRPAGPVAERRRERLLRAQRRVVAKKHLELVGRRDRILLERQCDHDRSAWIGRAARCAPEIDGEVRVGGIPPGQRRIGEFVTAVYLRGRGSDMIAQYAGK